MWEGNGKPKPCPMGSMLSVVSHKLECEGPCLSCQQHSETENTRIGRSSSATQQVRTIVVGETDPLQEMTKVTCLSSSVLSENVHNTSLWRYYSWKWNPSGILKKLFLFHYYYYFFFFLRKSIPRLFKFSPTRYLVWEVWAEGVGNGVKKKNHN